MAEAAPAAADGQVSTATVTATDANPAQTTTTQPVASSLASLLGDGFQGAEGLQGMNSVEELAKGFLDLKGSKSTPAEAKDYAYTGENAPENLPVLQERALRLGLNQEQFQNLVASEVELSAQERDARDKQVGQWEKETQERFGETFPQTVDLAQKALKAVGNETVSQALVASGFGSHPDVVNMFAEIGKLLGEDKLVNGKVGNPAPMARTPGGTPLLTFSSMEK